MHARAEFDSVRLALDACVDDADTAALWPAYDAVFGDQPDEPAWRASTWDQHVARDGFRLVRAYDDGRLVGFAYGCTGERGQWWTDRAATVLSPEAANGWLGAHFEIVSIGVLPAWRSAGIGRAMLREITAGLPHERRVLMTTSDEHDPATRLYASEGWVVIGPGLAPDQVIMAQGNARH